MESQISLPKSDNSFFDIAKNIGVKKFIFSAGSIEDINISYDLSLKGNNYYITSGIHPTRASEELNKENNINLIFENLNNLILKFFI